MAALVNSARARAVEFERRQKASKRRVESGGDVDENDDDDDDDDAEQEEEEEEEEEEEGDEEDGVGVRGTKTTTAEAKKVGSGGDIRGDQKEIVTEWAEEFKY